MEFNHSELKAWIKSDLLSHLKENTIVLLNGEVGAGKTEIVKICCELLGFDQVQSPTFSIFHTYSGPSKMKIHHVDLYRLKNHQDLDSTGFWDLFEKTEDLIFVEWAQLITQNSWPWGWKQIHLELLKVSPLTRKIKLRLES